MWSPSSISSLCGLPQRPKVQALGVWILETVCAACVNTTICVLSRMPKQEEANRDYALDVVPLTQQYIEVEAGGWKLAFERRTADDQASENWRAAMKLVSIWSSFVSADCTNRRRGDRIRVLGLNGSKKVQDMFVDEKSPPSQRERYPLLFDADGRLLWIPGIRRSSHALISPSTKELLFIRMTKE